MMKYKKGDKVVVEITAVDEKDKELTYGVGNPAWIRNECILGKLEDFTESKKIKFSEAEKKEFDKLLKNINNSNSDFADILNAIWNSGGDYHNLRRRLFTNANLIVDRKNQLELARKNQLEFHKTLLKSLIRH